MATVAKTKHAKRRGRAAHLGPERRRPQVLDAALAITFEQGVSDVTIGAIAERLKVTRPVVYACFADRVQIITALLERETATLRDALIESLHSARGDSPEAAFTAGYQSLLRVVESRPRPRPPITTPPPPANSRPAAVPATATSPNASRRSRGGASGRRRWR